MALLTHVLSQPCALCVTKFMRPPIAPVRGTAPVYRGCNLVKLKQRKRADPTCWRKGHRGSQRALLSPWAVGQRGHWGPLDRGMLERWEVRPGCEVDSLVLQGVHGRQIWGVRRRALSAVRWIEPGVRRERRGHKESTGRPLVQVEGDPLGMLERDAIRIRLSAHRPPACPCCVPRVAEVSRSPPAQPSAP